MLLLNGLARLFLVLEGATSIRFYSSSLDSKALSRETSANDILIVRLDEPVSMYSAKASILYVRLQ